MQGYIEIQTTEDTAQQPTLARRIAQNYRPRKHLAALIVCSPLLLGAQIAAASCAPDETNADFIDTDNDGFDDRLVATDVAILGGALSCDSSVGSGSKLVKSDVANTSNIGSNSSVIQSTLGQFQLGANSHVDRATLGSPETEAALGEGAVVLAGANIFAAFIGSNARIDRNANVAGGRGIDIMRIGNSLSLGAGAKIRIRSLGDRATIGARAEIGQSLTAGNDFSFGNDSRWDEGGSVGDNVTIGRKVTINGGFNGGNGVVIDNNSTLDFVVRLGNNSIVQRAVTIGSYTEIGDNSLIMNAAVINTQASIGNRVLIGRQATVGEGVTIGDGSIVDNGATVPANTDIPAGHLFTNDGAVIPLP
ncbi:DapH/DapD/GlmU-related protein [Granulosicoccus antarcticus]|uniref:UDP-3-O-(3-hydroxymyristoyl)glucosamine N-acyltransferase n=1 Tax=Granulosicoccus antarcticus IMCC3135 TaxID=1192854 RepID=A0A2Z2NS74_9GAMM|nr:DapH/DapD/GlmU-related protein [Granulosicoccus antarcticus]ASJ71590.1 UDP-3-O-(3-hydroxymyristoyl)glucosamine N-acyltransferase [Granulosicoccus antarcticus IMCC3135]